ncbi:hypothetical protein [Amycolatopsis circi]|uniref:hypothetical protein n=1 Tax=Amycolatopsis circi TaxID=871959 RepID=UPI000E2459D4|nr:hypothetical protein [Amycolatopsis circi]
MSIFARILQVFFMVLGLASIGVGLIMVLIARPYWTCEVSRNEPNYTSYRSTDLESFTSYHLFWFVLGLALEIMAVAVAAGARRKTVEHLLMSMGAPAAGPMPPGPLPSAPLPPGAMPAPGAMPGPYPGYPQQPGYPGQ